MRQHRAVSIMAAPLLDFDDTETAFARLSYSDLKRTVFLLNILRRPWLARMAQATGRLGLATRLPMIPWAIKRMVFDIFCGGTTLEEAGNTAASLAVEHVGCILDQAIENQSNEVARDRAFNGLYVSIEAISGWYGFSSCAVKASAIQDVELLARIQQGEVLQGADLAQYERGCARLTMLAEAASRYGVVLLVDAEESWFQKPVDAQVRVLMAKYNRHRALICMTIQSYLRECEKIYAAEVEEARIGGYLLGIKLVRGAYLEKERQHAKSKGLPDPTQSSKAHSDEAFDRIAIMALSQRSRVSLCVASHNEASIRKIVGRMGELEIPLDDPNIWFAQLYGMVDHVTFALARAGLRVAKYLPYGSVRDAFPYLIRRAEENRSVIEHTDRQVALIERELLRRSRLAAG